MNNLKLKVSDALFILTSYQSTIRLNKVMSLTTLVIESAIRKSCDSIRAIPDYRNVELSNCFVFFDLVIPL